VTDSWPKFSRNLSLFSPAFLDEDSRRRSRDKLHGTQLLAIVAQGKTSEVHLAVGRQTQRAAVFEFHFRAAIFARFTRELSITGRFEKRLYQNPSPAARSICTVP